MRTRWIFAAATLVALAGCGSGSGDTVRTGSSGGTSDTGLALRVKYAGGFVAPGSTFAQIPLVSIYYDGTMLRPGAQAAIYPGPALPNVQRGHVDAGEVPQLVADAVAAGVDGEEHDYGRAPVADAPDTVFTVVRGGTPQTTSVNALQESPGGHGLTAAQEKARADLKALMDRLTSLAGDTTAYAADRLAVLATDYGPLDDGSGVKPTDVAWPGPDPSAGQPVSLPQGRCFVLDTVPDVVRSANAITRWLVGDQAWRMSFRPLLPDEKGCDDLLSTPG